MRLLNISWQKENKLTAVLVLISFILVGFPILFFGVAKSFFFNIDPDIVYLTNAVSYTKYAIISYADHPGTPTIMLIYLLFIPFRLVAKYISGVSFLDWSFDNFALLTYLGRFVELLIFTVALYLFLITIRKLTKSKILTILSWLLLHLFIGYSFGIRIAPENLLFFFTAIWLILFFKFTKSRKYFDNLALVAISGLTVANKFTAVFISIASILMVFYVKKLKFDQKLLRFQINILIFIGAFYIGILPAIKRFTYIKNWANSLFLHSGTHATGSMAVFDSSNYFLSLNTLVKSAPALTFFIVFVFCLAVYLLFKRKIKIYDPYIGLYLVTMVGIFVFAKYPVIHYFIVNFIVMIFCSIYFLSKLKNQMIIKLLSTFVAINLLTSSVSYVDQTVTYLNDPKTETVYSMLSAWTPFWSIDIYREQLDRN